MEIDPPLQAGLYVHTPLRYRMTMKG